MRIILIAFIAIFTLSHCNDNSNAQSNPSNTNPGTYEVTINGTLWKAQNSTFNHT
jgi:ABC-type Fe3+-hydroxamate transport system substrate-binding protein